MCAVVLRVQALVGIEHTNQRDILKIQSLGHHLGADKDIGFAFAEFIQQAFVCALGGHGVRVHAEHPRGREPLVQLLLQLLRAGRFGEQARAAALRALAGYLDGCAAVVAHRAAGHRMVGHGGRARRALGHPAAHAAADHAAVAAPVEEQDGLLSLFERADQFALEVRPDDAAPSLAGQTAHVRDDDLGQSGTEKPLGERENRVFSLFCAVIRLDRRRCRAEHEQRVRLRRAVLCHIPRMVARRLLRAVRRVLLLVDDDNAEVLRGREHRRACADDHPCSAGFYLLEAVVPLTGGQRRVQNRDFFAKPGGKLPQKLRCQSNFGHEHNGALSLLERVRDELEIHLCLAAAGHAEQQRRTRHVFVHERRHAVIRLLLRRRKHRSRGARHLGKVRCAQHFLVFRAKDALFRHVAQRGVAHAGHVDDFLLAHRTAVRQQRHHVHPRRTAAADVRHGFTCFHSQTEHFFGLIAGFLYGIAVINEYPLACQRIQRLSRAFAEPIAYLAHRERLSRLLKQRQHLTFFAVPLPQSRQIRVRRERVRLVSLEPQAGGQHGVYAVEVGAVQSLPHPRRKSQLLGGQNRRFVQHLHDGLEFELARILAEGEHHRFRPFIAKAERHENTGADLHLFPQLVRHTVRI